MSATNAFNPKQEIQRTHYDDPFFGQRQPSRERIVANRSVNHSNFETPQPSKHLYGSPSRKQGIHQLYDQPGDDFFSGFGKTGAGAPVRDSFGNVITNRKAAVDYS